MSQSKNRLTRNSHMGCGVFLKSFRWAWLGQNLCCLSLALIIFRFLEGQMCPNHVAVAYRGHFFKMCPFEEDGSIWSPQKIRSTIAKIERLVESKSGMKSVGVLSTLPRQEWAKVKCVWSLKSSQTKQTEFNLQAREHLIELSPNNLKHLEAIESSILFVALNDCCPESEEELMRLTFAGCEKYRDVFSDKSWTRTFTKNGLYASQSEVSNLSGQPQWIQESIKTSC